MIKFIKVSKTVINAEDIEAVRPSSYRDHNGLVFPKVVIKLRNGNSYSFELNSDTEVQPMIDDIYDQITNLDADI